MVKTLIELATDRLKLAQTVTEHYQSYLMDSQMDMWSPMPIDSHACESVGEFIKELGELHQHFKLIGIGQSLIAQSEKLKEQEITHSDFDILDLK